MDLVMYVYSGLPVISNIPIPEVSQVDNVKGGFLFTLEAAQQQSRDAFWSHHWLSGSEQVLSYGKQGSRHCLRFPGLADFHISAGGRNISCVPLPKVPVETIRHLLLDQVLPRCLAHQGKLMLHASAVRLEGGLLLIIGDSGAGKSTLAGVFHQAGNPALSDDCIWIKVKKNQIVGVPSYGGLRLWDDSLRVLFSAVQEPDGYPMAHYSRKKRVALRGNDVSKFSKGIAVLAIVVISATSLQTNSEISLHQLSHREAFIAMLAQSFQLDLTDLNRMNLHMKTLGRIVPRLRTFQLIMPHTYELLPMVREKILEAVL